MDNREHYDGATNSIVTESLVASDVVAARFQGPSSSMSKLQTSPRVGRGRFLGDSNRALSDFIAGFEEAILHIDLDRIRRHWQLFLDRGRVVLLDRVLDRIEKLSTDPHREERAIACVEQAYRAMICAFERIDDFSFLSPEGFVSSLRLHAELALSDQLELFGPWELGRSVKMPAFRVTSAFQSREETIRPRSERV
jgi:hypothetical protein